MIEIWPAIDLINSQNVRLTEGVYETEEKMSRNPMEVLDYYAQFDVVKRVHIVDLIGAKEEVPKESEFIKTLIQSSKLPVEIGGGIRNIETIDLYLNAGAEYIVIGTKGLTDFLWLKQIAERYPHKIYLAVDADGNDIALNGWIEKSRLTVSDVISKINDFPLGGIIYTDISKDGKMLGPNLEMNKELVNMSKLPVIASGGVRNVDDIKALEAIGVHAAIVGKAANRDEFWEGFND